jgi:hypothetical protein
MVLYNKLAFAMFNFSIAAKPPWASIQRRVNKLTYIEKTGGVFNNEPASICFL